MITPPCDIIALFWFMRYLFLSDFSYEDNLLTKHWTTHNYWHIHWPVVFGIQNIMCRRRIF